jgi:limonene-1,2-epoxide hydrolase
MVFANVGVHADVEITLTMDRDGGEGATIAFGHTGPDLSIDFIDVDSLQRLAAVAADGARQLQERIDANTRVKRSTEQLVGAGATR